MANQYDAVFQQLGFGGVEDFMSKYRQSQMGPQAGQGGQVGAGSFSQQPNVEQYRQALQTNGLMPGAPQTQPQRPQMSQPPQTPPISQNQGIGQQVSQMAQQPRTGGMGQMVSGLAQNRPFTSQARPQQANPQTSYLQDLFNQVYGNR